MLHPLAQDGFYRITRDFDRETLTAFAVDFHDRLRELNDLACRVRRRPCGQDDVDRLDAPIIVGNVAFRRPCCAAMDWLRTCASAWWGTSRRAYTFALAFACGHRGEDAFLPLRSRPRASLACWRYCLGIRASEEAIRRASLSLLPPHDDSLRWFADPNEPESVDHDAPDLMAMAMRLSAKLGGTASHWLWDVADDDFWKAVCDLADEKDAELDAASIAAGKGRADGTWWKDHRRALARCETALESDAARWLAASQPKTPEAANG